MRSDSF